jgi:hypothetical protein
VDVDHDGGYAILADGLELGGGDEGVSGVVKGVAGGDSGLGTDVADRDRGDVVRGDSVGGPGVFDGEFGHTGSRRFHVDHDGHIVVDTDVVLVANVRESDDGTLEAIGNLGLADGNTWNAIHVGDVVVEIGDGAGFAIVHVEGFIRIGVQV